MANSQPPTMKKITFAAPDHLRAAREEAFLQLSPDERFQCFLRLIHTLSGFEKKEPQVKNNFIITLRGTPL